MFVCCYTLEWTKRNSKFLCGQDVGTAVSFHICDKAASRSTRDPICITDSRREFQNIINVTKYLLLKFVFENKCVLLHFSAIFLVIQYTGSITNTDCIWMGLVSASFNQKNINVYFVIQSYILGNIGKARRMVSLKTTFVWI